MLGLVSAASLADTPKLKIKLAHNTDREQQAQQQVERLAQQFDLKKYTLTRDIIIEQGAIPHSSPVPTLNVRFLGNDDLALSSYLHEQAHWVMMERHRNDIRDLIADLERAFPNLDYRVPQGDGDMRTSYVHIVVCMLEWHAMEELVGTERARKTTEWKQGDHYKDIYKIDLDHREQVEGIMKRYGIQW